jgi:hypothetical protein
MDLIENPVTTCGKILEYIDEMTVLIRACLLENDSGWNN